jgi:hypothetical protein
MSVLTPPRTRGYSKSVSGSQLPEVVAAAVPVRTTTISPDAATPSEVAQTTYLGLDPPGVRAYSNRMRRPTAPMSLLP